MPWLLILSEQAKFGNLCPLLRFRMRSQLEVPAPVTLYEAEITRVAGFDLGIDLSLALVKGSRRGSCLSLFRHRVGPALLRAASPSRGTSRYRTRESLAGSGSSCAAVKRGATRRFVEELQPAPCLHN